MPTNPARIVLASTSPQRRQLLADAGYEFEVMAPEVDEAEGLCSNCGPAELVSVLAHRKAAAVVKRLADDPAEHRIVIACDTVAECGGQILGKPNDEGHAREMLTLLAGSEHRVYSGLCVWPTNGAASTRIAITTLRMDALDAHQIDSYVASHAWEGKAGGFGYQDGLHWLRIVEGSESNVVGLPLETLAEMLLAANAAL